jgi:hypothetical protein
MTTPQWLILASLLILLVNNYAAIKLLLKKRIKCKTQ